MNITHKTNYNFELNEFAHMYCQSNGFYLNLLSLIFNIQFMSIEWSFISFARINFQLDSLQLN